MRRLASALLLCSYASCTNPLGNDRRDIKLHIAALVVPASAPAAGTFTATITVETGGCKRFERFSVTKTPTSAMIEAEGTDAGPDAICTQEIRLEQKTLDLSGPFSDPFTITAIQPDESVLTRTVRIR
ncbi:MAG: hypothetical protein ABIZ36_13945 [Gemmatimonadaceae bacterium]